MATYYNHCQVGIVDASGNVNVIYPQTYASDVKVGTANSSIGITTSSTVQSLISALGSAATKNVGDLVTNSSSSSSTSQAYSCNQINSKLNELNSNIKKDLGATHSIGCVLYVGTKATTAGYYYSTTTFLPISFKVSKLTSVDAVGASGNFASVFKINHSKTELGVYTTNSNLAGYHISCIFEIS